MALIPTEYWLLWAFHETLLRGAEAEYELAEIESVLRRGRAKGSRNKQLKALDPKIELALLAWGTQTSLMPNKSERAVARKLAFKYCPVKTQAARKKFADRLRYARSNRFRKMAEAME